MNFVHDSRILLALIVTLNGLNTAHSQSEQDCFGAIPVCTDFYSQSESYSGTGDISNELPGGFGDCLSIDANSVWYTFTVESDGALGFILTPNTANADYDWMLFDFSSGNCDQISSNSDLIVSCNSYGNFGENGPTGISSAMGGIGNSNGPGNTNGPEFNADLLVNAGETYLLYIQDWSGSTEGYELDFSGSTATIFDAESPEITSVMAECNGDVTVEFSENIDCANLELADFTVNTSLGMVSPNSLTSDCSGTNSTTNEVVLSFLPIPGFSLPSGENMTMQILGEDGLITDLCGNSIINTTFEFSTSDAITFSTETSPAECGLANGSATVINLIGGTAPISYTLNTDTQTDPIFDNLMSGTYTISVSDANGCFSSAEITVDEISTTTVNAGPNDALCNAVYQLSGTSTGDGEIEWISDDGLIFGDATALNSVVTAPEPGVYIIQLISIQNGCSSTDEVEISFSAVQNSYDNTLNTCAQNCSGELSVTTTNGIAPYTYTLNGAGQGIQSSFSELCTGEYTVEVTDAIGCTATESFSVSALIEPELGSSVITDVTCADACNGEVSLSTGAANVSSPQAEYDSTTSSFSNLCAGNFTYTLTSTDNCISTFTETIQTLSSINASLSASPNPVQIENPMVEITNLSTGNPINTELTVLSDIAYTLSADSTINFTGHDGTPLTIQLLAEDVYGCTSLYNYTLEFITPILVFIPNAFSPNNDGVNEVFKPIVSGIEEDEYEFVIFDRWGNEMFYTTDSSEPWLGNINGGDHYVKPDIYSYSIKVKQRFAPNYEQFYGTIQVVR
ncbi:MAG: gliding motility-associated C-terminal domain-containing protein [Flavobacteriales bacterium]